MPGKTNRGKYFMLDVFYRGATPPTNFYVALLTSAAAPDPDTNTFDDLTEVAAGNGYTAGGIQLNRNSTDFDVLTEDDTNDRALVQIKDIAWTASSGPLPSSGAARYAILTDDNGTQSARRVIDHWDLGGDRVVSDTQQLRLVDLEMRLAEA